MREMKDSGVEWIGEIPSNWNVFRNKNAFVCSKELVGDKSSETQLLSLTTKGIKLKDINNAEGKLPESFDTYQYVKENELVMCLFDLDCSAVFSGISPYAGMISPAYRVLTCTNRMIPKYADYWFQYISHGRKFNHYAKNIRYTLSYEEFSSLPMLFPDIEEQKRISDYLDSKCAKIDSIIEKQQAIIEKLKEYKLSIITEAVTKGLRSGFEMKASGAEFVGNIPSTWNVAKLGSLFDFIGGYAFNSELYVSESQNQVVRIGNVKNGYMPLDSNPVFVSDETAELAKKFLIKPDYILFTMTGTKGKRDYFYTHVVSEKDCEGKRLYINQRVGCFVAKEGVCPEYYGYLLKDNRILDGIFLYETGTANQGNLGIDSISRTKVHVPPYEEQVEISEYLNEKCNSIDKSVEGRKAVVEKLMEYKKSLIYEVVTGKKEV